MPLDNAGAAQQPQPDTPRLQPGPEASPTTSSMTAFGNALFRTPLAKGGSADSDGAVTSRQADEAAAVTPGSISGDRRSEGSSSPQAANSTAADPQALGATTPCSAWTSGLDLHEEVAPTASPARSTQGQDATPSSCPSAGVREEAAAPIESSPAHAEAPAAADSALATSGQETESTMPIGTSGGNGDTTTSNGPVAMVPEDDKPKKSWKSLFEGAAAPEGQAADTRPRKVGSSKASIPGSHAARSSLPAKAAKLDAACSRQPLDSTVHQNKAAAAPHEPCNTSATAAADIPMLLDGFKLAEPSPFIHPAGNVAPDDVAAASSVPSPRHDVSKSLSVDSIDSCVRRMPSVIAVSTVVASHASDCLSSERVSSGSVAEAATFYVALRDTEAAEPSEAAPAAAVSEAVNLAVSHSSQLPTEAADAKAESASDALHKRKRKRKKAAQAAAAAHAAPADIHQPLSRPPSVTAAAVGTTGVTVGSAVPSVRWTTFLKALLRAALLVGLSCLALSRSVGRHSIG